MALPKYDSYVEMPDNRRRGNPLPGCDCLQCFGRCIIDQDAAARIGLVRVFERRRVALEDTDAM
jgi:hypothetical protein